jgi:hypothetical protein
MFDWYLVVIPRAYDIVGHVQSMVYMIEPIVEACDTILIPSCSSGDEAHYILLNVTPIKLYRSSYPECKMHLRGSS